MAHYNPLNKSLVGSDVSRVLHLKKRRGGRADESIVIVGRIAVSVAVESDSMLFLLC